jgi:hypothetical protein
MHGPTPPHDREAGTLPIHIRTLRVLLYLAKDNRELEDAVVYFAIALGRHAIKLNEIAYDNGLQRGRIRGRRLAKGLDEIPKPRGRPKSLDRRLKELGFSLDDVPEPPPLPRRARR